MHLLLLLGLGVGFGMLAVSELVSPFFEFVQHNDHLFVEVDLGLLGVDQGFHLLLQLFEMTF